MVSLALPVRLHFLSADVLELAPADAMLSRSKDHHREVDEEDDEDKANQLPATEVPSCRIWHKGTEHNETVGTDQGQSLIH